LAAVAINRAAKSGPALSAAVLGIFLCCSGPAPRADGLAQIEHIVVVYPENRSFDHMYGMFPGANGVAIATPEQKTQLDHDGTPLPHLPSIYLRDSKTNARVELKLPNGPFRVDAPPINWRMDQFLPSPIHSYYHNIEQINGGRNDRFVAMTTAGAWTMAYFDGSGMNMWRWARDYVLADNFFQAAFGGSLLNHLWLVCACTPVFPDAPAAMRAQPDETGKLKMHPASPESVLDGPAQLFDGPVTPDGYAVNNVQPAYQPSGYAPASGGDFAYADPAKNPLPPQTKKTIGDTLSAKGVSWAWYAGGWNRALADGRRAPTERRTVIYSREGDSPIFQAHHQPFNYFARFAPGSQDRTRHLRDGEEFFDAIAKGALPRVAFYKPAGRLNQHPSYTDMQSGDAHLAELLERLRKSPQWPKMAVIVTYDENGGYWDHVAPPAGPGWGDRWGPGTRVPAIIVSPFARRGYVDHTAYDTTSILKFITKRFDLEPLPGVRANMGDLTNAFDLAR